MRNLSRSELDLQVKQIIKDTPKVHQDLNWVDRNAVWGQYWENNDTEKEVRKIDRHLRQWRDTYLEYVKENHRILDGGCGLGKWVVYLQGKGFNIIGVEYEEESNERDLSFFLGSNP